MRHHDPGYVRRLFSGCDELKFETEQHATMNGNQSNGFYLVVRSPGPSEEGPEEETGELEFPDLDLSDDNSEPGDIAGAPAFEPVPDEDSDKKVDMVSRDRTDQILEALIGEVPDMEAKPEAILPEEPSEDDA